MYYSPYPNTKLFIDMIPFAAWGINLRSDLFILESEWDRLRRETYSRANNRCEVCWSKGPSHPVECHEQWHFDEDTRVQSLRGLVALCPMCHAATHFGFSSNHNPLVDEALLRYHLAVTNKWTLEKVDQHLSEALDICKRRNTVVWALDLSLLEREYHDLLTLDTLARLGELHASLPERGALPTDVVQPVRDGARPSSSVRSKLREKLGITGKVPSRVRMEHKEKPRLCMTPRIPGARPVAPSVQRLQADGWVDDCAAWLAYLLGQLASGPKFQGFVASINWTDGMPLDHLAQLALGHVLLSLEQTHAGDTCGFFDALEGSPLVPIPTGQAGGPWSLSYGFKALMHRYQEPSHWVMAPRSEAVQWGHLAKRIHYVNTVHEDRMNKWKEQALDIYEDQLVAMYELAIHDSAYVRP